MNTGLDCDRLGGVGQGSGAVNIARTHAGMYARTGGKRYMLSVSAWQRLS